MKIIRKMFLSLYYNGGVELVFYVTTLVLTCFLFPLGNVSMIMFGLYIISLIVFIIEELVAEYRKKKRKEFHSFILKPRIGITCINQAGFIPKTDKCPIKDFIKDLLGGINKIPQGTYITFTHEAIVKELKKYAEKSGRIVILDDVFICERSLRLARNILIKSGNCKKRSCCEKCTLFDKKQKFKMHGIKFEVIADAEKNPQKEHSELKTH